MSLEVVVPILHAGGSEVWVVLMLKSGGDSITRQHPERPSSLTEGQHCLLHMGDGPRKGGLKKARLQLPSWRTAANGHLLQRQETTEENEAFTRL